MKNKSLLALLLIFICSAGSVFANGNGTPGSTESASAFPTSLSVNSNKYNTAVGVRGIGTSGITIKHFTGGSRAWEGIIGLWPNTFSATFLIERYVNAFDEPGLNWYYGMGGHIATWSGWEYYDGVRGYRRQDGDLGLGVDGIFGLEYKIREVPIAISLDVKPFLEVTTTGSVYLAMDPGLGVKLTF